MLGPTAGSSSGNNSLVAESRPQFPVLVHFAAVKSIRMPAKTETYRMIDTLFIFSLKTPSRHQFYPMFAAFPRLFEKRHFPPLSKIFSRCTPIRVVRD
jgi:hypothetical protein